MNLRQTSENNACITYEGVFDNRIDIRVECAVDGRDTITVYADNGLVGTLESHAVAESDISFVDAIGEFLELANVGR